MSAPVLASKSWRILGGLAGKLRTAHLRDLFAADGERFRHLSLEQCGLLLDYSKQRLTPEVMAALRELWWAADLPGWLARLQAGEAINHTEGRAVLHQIGRAHV